MLWQQMMEFMKSWFVYPGLSWGLMLIAIGLGIAFGAIWLCAHWVPLKRYWLWAVAVAGAFLGLLAVTFLQIPLQYYIGQALQHFWSIDTLNAWLLLVAIPQILVSGLVQEGAKMVPMVAWWWRSGKKIDPKLGLAIGAVAGAGFGIFEAVWVHGSVLASGWTFDVINTYGFLGISPFWERFFTIGFHIAVSALAGYGLAKGKAWQYFLIASGLHAIVNYAPIVLNYSMMVRNSNVITVTHVEIFLAVVAVAVTAVVMILRWRKGKEEVQIEPEELSVEPEMPAKIDV